MMKHAVLRYDVYKVSVIAEIKAIPEHWNIRRIKEVGSIKYGLSQPPEYLEEGLPLIRATNIERGRIVEKGLVFISSDDVPYERDPVLKMNDIVVVRSGAYTADSAIVPEKYDGAIAGFDMVLRPYHIEVKYLAYILLSNYVLRDQLILSSFRAAQPHLNKEELGNTLIFYPPLPEQKAIADYLDTKTNQIDQKMNLLTQKATQYGKLKQSLINETVTRGLEKTVAMKDSGVEWIGEVPEHWEVKRVKELFGISRGRVIAQTELIDDGKYPVYSSQTKDDGCLGYINTFDYEGAYITWTTDGVNAGTVFLRSGRFNCTNICGTLKLLKKDCHIGYLIYSLKVSTKHNKRIDTNGAKIMSNEMMFIKITVPPENEQKAISDYLDTKTDHIDRIVETINTQINKLKELRKTLINDVVTGKIKVAMKGEAV